MPGRHSELEAKLRLARAYAAHQLPYFSEVLFAARWILSDRVPALAAIDRHLRLYFNPSLIAQYFDSLDQTEFMKQIGWVFIHEVSHVMRDHAGRAEVLASSYRAPSVTESQSAGVIAPSIPFSHYHFNVAGDLEINDNHFAGLTPPQKYRPLTCNLFGFESDLLAEQYYDLIMKQADLHLAEPYFMDEGSGVHGQDRPWELEPHSQDVPAIGADYQEALRHNLANAICNQGIGSLSAGWSRWAESFQPVVDWRRILRSKLQRMMSGRIRQKSFNSYRRPHRRATAFSPFIRPGVVETPTYHIAVVIDTSGSMDQAALNRCASELRGILTSVSCNITAIPCDAEAYKPAEIVNGSHLPRHGIELMGGGGTDMRVGIEAAVKLDEKA